MFILLLFLPLICATDYCKICANGSHSMCKYKEGPSSRCNGYVKVALTKELKNFIVDVHNDIRSFVASGQEKRGTFGEQPSAADMLTLHWDEELAFIAQRWADQCIQTDSRVQHDSCRKTNRFDVGQNTLTAILPDSELPDISLLIQNWYNQVVNVLPSDVDTFSGVRRGQHLIGQYSQLVWSRTKYIGCGISIFQVATNDHKPFYHHRFVCNYGPAGNVVGERIYQRGQPCSMCLVKGCNTIRNNLCDDLVTSSFFREEELNRNSIQTVKGVWYYGVCRCNNIYRSSSVVFRIHLISLFGISYLILMDKI